MNSFRKRFVRAAAVISASLLLGSGSALTQNGPDFDCKRANSPVEQMICHDGDLARETEELGVVYRRKLGALTGSERAALIQSERDWLARRDSDCGLPASGARTDTPQAKNCLLQKVRSRKDELSR